MFTMIDDAPYSRIAKEYYDPVLHKTSRNFDEAGRPTLREWANDLPAEGLVLDAGAGRGRCTEFFGTDASRIVQLDSSREMLRLEGREDCIIKICHAAETLPFLDGQFAVVAGFLCDPFLGLNFLAESYRVL